MDSNNFDIFTLVNNLCVNAFQERYPNTETKTTYVQKLRSIAFEILLNKSKNRCFFENLGDPIKELEIICFSKSILGRNNSAKALEAEQFEQLLNIINKEQYFLEGAGSRILSFLLFLRKCDVAPVEDFQPNLLVPGTFLLNWNNENLPHLNYSNLSGKKLQHLKMQEFNVNDNPYIPKWLSGMQNLSEKLNMYKMIQIPSKNYLPPLKPQLKSIMNCESIIKSKSGSEEITSSTSFRRFGWNWECLGNTNIEVEPHFISECTGFTHLKALMGNNKTDIKIVSVNRFLADLKSLLIGVESDTFEFDKNTITFKIVDNLTIPDVTPSILHGLITECLDCGNCFKRLQIMIARINYQHLFEGFTFQALCSAVEDYLMIFRKFVYCHEDKNLLEFFERIQKPTKQIIRIAFILTIYSKTNTGIEPPRGSQFLGYIYKEILKTTQIDILFLLFFILKRCCQVYLKYLQKWIFLGELDDSSNELFISFIDYYPPNTKYFFDKAYFIRKEYVPGFFQGYEENVLQCGKYTMLLKTFNPNHPIFSIEHPSMNVCFCFDELCALEKSCDDYLEKALKVCESPITVDIIYNKEKEKKIELKKKVNEAFSRTMEIFKAEKIQSSAIQAAEKRERLKELTQQITEARRIKDEEKKENIILERKLMKQQEQLIENLLYKENLQTQKQIEILQNLNEINTQENTQMSNSKCEQKLNTKLTIANEEITEKESFNSNNDNTSEKNNNLIDDFVEDENFNEVNRDLNGSIPSVTDIKNQNLNECQKNKLKVLGSEYDILCPTIPENLNLNSQTSIITELQSNRTKMMQTDIIRPKTSEILNPSSQKLLVTTELQKNRTKMMETTCLFEKENSSHVKKNEVFLNTDRAKNKKKILENEFYIFPDESKQITQTPMSTSSDSFFDEEILEIEKNNNCELIKSLKENQIQFENLTENKTENSSLNLEIKSNEIESNETNVTNATENDTLIGFDNFENYKPYDKCMYLLENNFTCETFTKILNLRCNNSQKENFDTSSKKKLKKISQDRNNFNGLVVITITEFLQKSLSLPLKAHLQVMNNEIMRIFLKNLDIIGHFHSLRKYFLLMEGEFGSVICDELITKLENGAQPVELYNFQALHSILEKSIGCSKYGLDKNSERLSFIVSDLPESFDISSPSVFLNLCLCYKVTWPLNLILNPETLEKYGDIFKFLLKLRRISWILEQCSRILRESLQQNGKELLMSPQYRQIQMIRYKFFHFIHALGSHITANALEASWKEFEDDLLKAKCIEDIYRKHTTYIKKILFLCMLNKSSLDFNKTIENIFKVTLRFYRNLKCKQWKKQEKNFYVHPRFEKILIDEDEFEKLVKFIIYLGNKIVKRGYQKEIGELISFINFNQYYLNGT